MKTRITRSLTSLLFLTLGFVVSTGRETHERNGGRNICWSAWSRVLRQRNRPRQKALGHKYRQRVSQRLRCDDLLST